MQIRSLWGARAWQGDREAAARSGRVVPESCEFWGVWGDWRVTTGEISGGAVEFWGEPPSRAHAPQGLGEFWGLGAAILELVLGRKEDTPLLLSVERKRNFHFLGPPQPPSSRSPRISWTGSGGCEGGLLGDCEGLRPPLKFASRYERHVPIIAAPYAFRFTENVS